MFVCLPPNLLPLVLVFLVVLPAVGALVFLVYAPFLLALSLTDLLLLAEHVDTERRNVCHADWIDHAHAVVQRGVVWRPDVQRGHHAVGDHRHWRHVLR